MVYNTKHYPPELKGEGVEEYTKKLFWLQVRGSKGLEVRVFELEPLYLELEKFLERVSSPVIEKR